MLPLSYSRIILISFSKYLILLKQFEFGSISNDTTLYYNREALDLIKMEKKPAIIERLWVNAISVG